MEHIVQRDYWPTHDWQTAAPEDMDVNSTTLGHMQAHITTSLPGLHGLLIVRHGYLIFEEYYHGFHRQSYNSISSATKSVVSALIGVALTQGKLHSLDQRMLDFFPEYASAVTDPRKQAITVRHLLSLTSGFAQDMPHEYWRNPVKLARERAMAQQPGEVFYYDSQAVDILAGILTCVTGVNAATFADGTLFKPLGIWQDKSARFPWRADPQGTHGPHVWHEFAFWDEQDGYLWKVDRQGNNTGGFGIHLTAREMAKLGYLYLNRGSWNGQQLIAADYVAESTRQQSAGGKPLGVPYGYLWWITQHVGHDTFFASGFGGKLIYVIPDLDIVVVTIASAEKALQNPQQSFEIEALIPQFVIPAMR